jgi:TonB family protein
MPPSQPAEGEVDRLASELKARNEVVLGVCEDLEKCKPLPGDVKIENGQVISKPQPAYPPIAKAARAQGSVRVLLIVDEEGKVVAAQAVGGHPLLQLAAVKAAREARFTPTLMNGKPVKVSGAITYNFVLE